MEAPRIFASHSSDGGAARALQTAQRLTEPKSKHQVKVAYRSIANVQLVIESARKKGAPLAGRPMSCATERGDAEERVDQRMI
jgi:hypothetical protein